jgi:hypothetical protein
LKVVVCKKNTIGAGAAASFLSENFLSFEINFCEIRALELLKQNIIGRKSFILKLL